MKVNINTFEITKYRPITFWGKIKTWQSVKRVCQNMIFKLNQNTVNDTGFKSEIRNYLITVLSYDAY